MGSMETFEYLLLMINSSYLQKFGFVGIFVNSNVYFDRAMLKTVWALIELTIYCLLVTLAPLGKDGTVSMHKYVFYVTAACVSGTHLICSVLLVVAAYKKLASLTLPWTIVTGIITSIYFLLSFTGISLVLQDEGEMLEVESVVIFIHLARSFISVYCIVVVHSRHKQIMHEEDETRFQHSGRIYHPVKLEDHVL